MPKYVSVATAHICPGACEPSAWHMNASNQGSKGRSPWPGVQGWRPTLAARRVGEQHSSHKGISASLSAPTIAQALPSQLLSRIPIDRILFGQAHQLIIGPKVAHQHAVLAFG